MKRASGAEIGTVPDDGLVRRAQRGDATALNVLARTVLPRLRRWARTHVDGADEADDVAQAALIAAVRGIARFDFRARLDTWLYRIVRRCAADHHRRRRRRAHLMEREFAALREDWVEPDETDLDVRRAAEAVRCAFRTLPARQREVFDLVDLQGFSAEEVAGMLGTAAPTVRVHLLRARRRLRRIMLETEPAFVEDRNGLQDRT